MPTPDSYRRIECSNPDEFLDALSLRGPHFRDHEAHAWVFPGQAADSWLLVPQALRPETQPLLDAVAGPPDMDRGPDERHIANEPFGNSL